MNDNYLETSSAQLVQVDESMMPVGVASGCIACFMNKRLLLTVEHATGNQGNWAIELEYEKKNGARLYQLGGMNFLMKFTLPNENGETVDFSYVEIPDDLQVFRHYLTPQGETIRKDIVHTYSSDFSTMPTEDESYGFAGGVLTEIAPNPYQPHRPHLIREFRCYKGLKFNKRKGDFSVYHSNTQEMNILKGVVERLSLIQKMNLSV